MKKILDIIVVLALILFMYWSVQHAHADSVIPSRLKLQALGVGGMPIPSSSIPSVGTIALTNTTGNPKIFFYNPLAVADQKYTWLGYGASGGGSRLELCFSTDASFNGCGKQILLFNRTGTALTGLVFGNASDNPVYTFGGTGTASFGGAATIASTLGVTGATTLSSTLGVTGTLTGAAANLGTVTSSDSYTVSTGSTNALPLDVEGTVTTGLTGRLKNNSVNVAAFAKYQILNINNHGVEITANNAATDNTGYNCSTATCSFTDNTNQFLLHTNSTRATVVGDTGGVTNVQGTSVQINGSTLVTTSSFTATVTGMTAGTTGTVFYRIVGNVAYLYTQTSISGTSNSTVLTLTGLPAAIQPAHEHVILSYFTDNGTLKMGLWDVTSSGTVVMSVCATTISCSASGFTASGSKGLQLAFTVSYPLD